MTIFGESAGAQAIGILMASPLAKGLFEKAIGASGAFWTAATARWKALTERARDEAFAKRVNAPSIAALRAMPAEALNAAAPWNFSTNQVPGTLFRGRVAPGGGCVPRKTDATRHRRPPRNY